MKFDRHPSAKPLSDGLVELFLQIRIKDVLRDQISYVEVVRRVDERGVVSRPVSVVDVSVVIAVAFYPLLLTVTSKFGVHFRPTKKQPFRIAVGRRSLLAGLYLFTHYALRC